MRQCRYCPLVWAIEYDDDDRVLHDSDTTCPRCGSDDAVPFARGVFAPDWSEYAAT